MPVRAVLMAGGLGQRLRPLTAYLPKPLMPVGDRPVLEIIIRRLVAFDITAIDIAVGHLSHLIRAYFGDGARFGAKLNYVEESLPLGTAGALANVPDLDTTAIVMNADILADLDFDALLDRHRSAGATVTVASRLEITDIAAGVLVTNAEGHIVEYREKPRLAHRIGLGVYAVEPAVVRGIPKDQRLDMPDLITSLIAERRVVASYDHAGNWIDIGRPEDLARAQDEIVGWTATRGPGAAPALAAAPEERPTDPGSASTEIRRLQLAL